MEFKINMKSARHKVNDRSEGSTGNCKILNINYRTIK